MVKKPVKRRFLSNREKQLKFKKKKRVSNKAYHGRNLIINEIKRLHKYF